MHYLGLVIVKEPTKAAVDEAMAEFHEKHWDWYRCGGRWDGWLTDEEAARQTSKGFNFAPENDNPTRNSCLVRDLPANKRPHFLVTPDGYWIPREYWNEFEKSPYGLGYGAILPTPDFEARIEAELAKHPDAYAVVVDAHN